MQEDYNRHENVLSLLPRGVGDALNLSDERYWTEYEEAG